MDIESASQTMRPSSVVVAVVLAAISVLPSFEHVTATDCDESGSCYTNPVIANNHPDPGCYRKLLPKVIFQTNDNCITSQVS